MYKILIILFLIFLFSIQKNPLYNKQGRPSTYGIDYYIKNNELNLIKEYKEKIDTLYDVYIYTENLSKIKGDLGEFYIPDNIVITNEELFIAYEMKDLSKFRQKTLSCMDNTVKSVVFHELTHAYVNQIIFLMRRNNISVSPEYGSFKIFPRPDSEFASKFIEEGICEYAVYYLKESAPLKNIVLPNNKEELLDKNNEIDMLYCYSVIFLKDFLDKNGIKKGIEILMRNNPPTYEEMLKPESFYKRINEK